MATRVSLGPALHAAIGELRSQIGDPTASILILVPSAGTKEIARRSLASAGAFIRVDFATPGELVSDLGELQIARGGGTVESAGWLSATLITVLRRFAEQGPHQELAETLTEKGWLPTVGWAIRELEGGGLGPQDLECVQDGEFGSRVALLAALLKSIREARERAGLVSQADLCQAAKTEVANGALPANRHRGALILGDTILSRLEFEVVEAWIRARLGLRLQILPFEHVPPAPFGLRGAAAEIPSFEVGVEGEGDLQHFQRSLFTAPAAPAPEGASVVLHQTPDENREMKEVVRVVQRAVHAGTPLDRIAVALPDGDAAEALDTQLGLAGIDAVWLVGPPVTRTPPARLMRLVLDVASGDESVRTWHRLLRFPGLRLRANLPPEAVVGPGRWRRILARCGATEQAELIERAVRRYAAKLDPADELTRGTRESAESLLACLERLASEIAAFPRDATLADHAEAWRSFLRAWLPASPDRARLERILDRWRYADGEATLDLETARGLFDESIGAEQALKGSLTAPAIRVLPPMELLAGEFDLVCITGLSEGRFPRKRSEDVLLTDDLIDAINGSTAGRLLTSRDRADLERRRLAAAVAAARAKLHLFCPAADFMTGRPVRPGRLLLEVASALLGRRARYQDLHEMMERSGRRAFVPVSNLEDSVGGLEHLMSRIGRDTEANLAHLLAHPVARRLIQLQRSVDRFRQGMESGVPYFDAWTGRITPAAVRCAVSGDGAADAQTYSEAALAPGSFFFRKILRAYPAPRLPRAFDPTHKARIQRMVAAALLRALDRTESLEIAFDLAWAELEEEALKDAPALEQDFIDLARRLGRYLFDRLVVQHPDVAKARRVEGATTSVDDLVPWDLETGDVVDVDGVITDLTRGAVRKTLRVDDGFPLVLTAVGLERAGIEVSGVQKISVEADRGKADQKSLREEVLALARRTYQRAHLGLWPIFGGHDFALAKEAAIKADLLDVDAIDRWLEALSK